MADRKSRRPRSKQPSESLTDKPQPEPNPASVSIDQPDGKGPIAVGAQYAVTGSALPSDGATLKGVVLSLDGSAVAITKQSPDWTSWSASITVTAVGVHTLSARATDTARKEASTTVKLSAVIDVPALSCVKPQPDAAHVIVTQLVSVPLEISARCLAANVTAVQYQVGGGAWTDLARPDASTPNWHGAVNLPSAVAAAGGTTYPLNVRATTSLNTTGALALTLKAVDRTKPALTFTPADGVPQRGGAPLVVTAYVNDRLPGVVTSGVASVTVLLDDEKQFAATETSPGGDATVWVVNVGTLAYGFHVVTVRAKDAEGNVTTAVSNFGVILDSWSRFEPISRDPTLMEGLQARIADPLWMLARQLAFGEFTGHDAASPVAVRLRGRYSTLTRVRPLYVSSGGSPQPATGSGEPLPANIGPLETLTEAEPEPPAGAPRPLFSAQAGSHYLHLLRTDAAAGDTAAYIKNLIAAYPLPVVDDPLLRPYAGSVPDGSALYADLAQAFPPPNRAGNLPAAPAIGAAGAAGVTAVAKRWLDWYDAVSGRSLGIRDTWRPDRMEYAFSTAAPGPGAETVLAAQECDTGELDWFDFDLLASSDHPPAAGVSLGAVAADWTDKDHKAGRIEDSFQAVGFPTPISFRGMPNRRWWDFDDASIDFGNITAPVEDVATSLIVEFAMRYGNDQFMIPVKLPVGSVCRIDSLVVTDTYGEVLAVRSIADLDGAAGPFRLFEHTLADPNGKLAANRDPLFVLFPTVGEIQTGTPIEEVHFVRDEAAEVVWAIEHTAPGPAGVPADRDADATALFHPLPVTPNDGSALPVRTYVLRTDVEQNWFPFLLPDDASGTSLVLGEVPPRAGGAAPTPWGRILAPFMAAPPQGMPQEEVTRAGVQVVRAWRYARWTDGRQLSWVGRRVRPGRGPGASGLSFDLAL